MAFLPTLPLLDDSLRAWLAEDIGRGDLTVNALCDAIEPEDSPPGAAVWVAKAPGIVAGLPIAQRVFQLLDPAVQVAIAIPEGAPCQPGQCLMTMRGSLAALLSGERVALNLAMRLSGIATLTRQYAEAIADTPARLVDTRKTTPGLRVLEKYATRVGGALNHRLGLDDAVMLKDNHIAAAGSIAAAVRGVRSRIPLTATIEVETESLAQVEEALASGADIIMLDNMPVPLMAEAIACLRARAPHIKIEVSGNVTLETIRTVALLAPDFISTSAMVTRSSWLDISMKLSQG